VRRRTQLACLLLAASGPALSAQTPGWTRQPSLRFLGLRAGIPIQDTSDRITELYGAPLTCSASTVDPAVADCRSSFPEPITGRPVEVWLSSIDSLVAVLTVSGPVTPVQLQAWRSSLVSAYGEATPSVQGSQVSLQWVRHRQMLRLTWRDMKDSTMASVSLVDGPVLDGWNRRRRPATTNP